MTVCSFPGRGPRKMKWGESRVANDSRPGRLIDSKFMVELKILVVIICHDHAVVVDWAKKLIGIDCCRQSSPKIWSRSWSLATLGKSALSNQRTYHPFDMIAWDSNLDSLPEIPRHQRWTRPCRTRRTESLSRTFRSRSRRRVGSSGQKWRFSSYQLSDILWILLGYFRKKR